jgi:hypothetical protein
MNGSSLVNVDNSHLSGIPFSSTSISIGRHTLYPPGNNIDSAAAIYPRSLKGGKINRHKINKISKKYKMRGSKKTIKRRVRRMKGRVRSRYSNRRARSYSRRHMRQKGGAFQPAMTTPNYPDGYNQYNSNAGNISNVYSLGGQLSSGYSALANPPPQSIVDGANVPDILNHNTLNSYRNIGAGSGFLGR